jgi:hypothetical protein
VTDVLGLAPGDHDLSPAECAELARRAGESVAATVAESDLGPGRRRLYQQLWRDDYSEAWLLSWSERRDTGFHDHHASCGAVHVVAGRVTEEPFAVRGPAVEHEYGPGETFPFSAGHIHRMHHDPGAVTIHVYSPPIGQLGIYEVVDGNLKRTPQSADEESPETPSVSQESG